MLQTQGKGNHTLYSYHIIYHSSSHLLSPQNTKRGQERSPILKGFKVPLLPRFKSKPQFLKYTLPLYHIWTTPPPPPRTYTARVCERARLHLLSTPAPIRLAHILRRLDTGDELEHHVHQADYPDDGPENDVHGVVLEQDGAAEDVNCGRYLASAKNSGLGLGRGEGEKRGTYRFLYR